MTDARAGKAPAPYVKEVSPLRAFVDQAMGKAPAETVDGSDPKLSGAWLRLSARERQDCDSPNAATRAYAQRVLRSYVEADPASDPVAAHFLEAAKAAPRSAPERSSRTVESEAWERVSAEPKPWGTEAETKMWTLDRVAELEAEITEERAAAAEEGEG
jgi:hypothetical protein